MEESPKEVLTHTLALVVVAALLIFAAAALGSLKLTPPSWMSQAAATSAPESNAPPTAEQRKAAIEAKCKELLPKGPSGSLIQQFRENTTEQDMCVGVVKEGTQLRCVGKISKVKMDTKGQGVIESQATNNLPMGICQTTFCDPTGNKCSPARTLAGTSSLKDWAKDPYIFSNLDPELQKLVTSGLNSAELDALNRAFAVEGKELENQITNAQQARDAAQERLNSFTKGCGSQSSCDGLETVKADLQQKEQMLVALETQKQRLAAAKVSLNAAPPPKDTNTPPPDPDPVYRDPNGTFTQPPPNQQGGKGGFEQFLQGFMKAFQGGQGGGQPPPGNQNPRAPGTCNPQLVCSGNTLYSRNTQCVDTPVQQCPNGCSGNACVQQPGAPTAQLSCQPQVADPGMIVTISWGCSAGTSTGNGFSTGVVRSGSATTTLATPPTGANTISFGLVCTNEGRSASTSCDIQVGKPAIVLVANPKSVSSGEKSQIGWVTSGMKECTVSSPEQADFTARNATRTNASGVAETSSITGLTNILLSCTTLGGKTRQASTTVSVL